MTKFRLPIQVCVFLFREQEGGREYLLLHRVPGVGAFWQGVTGAPEEGETLFQGAAREVLEETGFTPARISSLNFTYHFAVINEWREAWLSTASLFEYANLSSLARLVRSQQSVEFRKRLPKSI